VRALWWSLVRFAPLPLGVILINLLVDPVRVAQGDAYERGIAAMLLHGQGVTNISNPKDAAVVRAVIEGLPRSPDVIVLGSSRSKLVRGQFFGGRTTFNTSVSGGGLTDYLAFHQLYRQRQFAPALIIIEVSPWVLEPAYASIWEDRYPPRHELEREIRDTGGWSVAELLGRSRSFSRAKDIISPGYFQTSVMTWLQRKQPESSSAPQTQTYRAFQPGDVPFLETQLPDGSVIYAERFLKESTRQQLRADAIAYANGSPPLPRAIDADRVALFDAFVRQLQREDAKTVFYLPPYHPVTYERLQASRAYVPLPEVERTVRMVAMRTGSVTIGSYDPQAAGLGEDDFFDPSHPTADAVARLFAPQYPAAATTSDHVRVAGISTPNGLEMQDGHPFFWIGQSPACISLKAGAASWIRLAFKAVPGPSLSTTARRRVAVSSTAPGLEVQNLTIEGEGQTSLVVPVVSGLTDTCFTALDRPNRERLPNGDTRSLLLGIASPRIEAYAPTRDGLESPCRVRFAKGWYPAEGDAKQPLRWSSGPAELILSARRAGQVTLSGQTIAVTRPEHVNLMIGSKAVGSFEIPAGDWVFRPFSAQTVEVAAGETRLQLIPDHPAVSLSGDSRRLAVALQNLAVTMQGSVTPCEVESSVAPVSGSAAEPPARRSSARR